EVAPWAGRQVVDRDVRQAGAEVAPRGAGARELAGGVHPGVGGQGQLAVGEHQGVRGDVRQVAGDVGPGLAAVRGLEDVPGAPAGDEPPGVPVEHRVGVGRVGRVDGDAGDVPVRQAGRVHLVPGAAVVGGDARGE